MDNESTDYESLAFDIVELGVGALGLNLVVGGAWGRAVVRHERPGAGQVGRRAVERVAGRVGRQRGLDIAAQGRVGGADAVEIIHPGGPVGDGPCCGDDRFFGHGRPPQRVRNADSAHHA